MEEAEPDEHRYTPTPSVSSTASSSSSLSPSPSLSSSNSDNNGDSSSTSSQVHEEEDEEEEEGEVEEEPQELEQRRISIPYNNPRPLVNEANGDESTMIRDDTWSCVVVILTFWFFVSMTMVLGVYGPVNVRLGPNSSLLLQPNPLFVHYMKVEELDKSKAGMMLYGFHKPPPLDVVATWSEAHDATLVSYSDKEWIYFLNQGSEFNISYNVNSLSNSSVVLVIAQGNEGIAQWLEEPAYPNTTLSWNMIHGRGMIQQNILKSSRYYVAVGNLDSEVVEVQLNISIRATLYNTTKAYYKCSLNYGLCSFNLLFAQGNAAVLTSTGPNQSTSSEEFYVRLSYGSRWITYIAGIGGMTVFMLVAFNFFNKFQCSREVEARVLYGQTASDRAPLLSHKDDDLSSWGSSYDSVSHDEEDPEDLPAVGSLEGKPLKEGEDNNNPRRLCVICFEAPRDCFFLPCGHCVACFTCGTRIAEAAGTCPICRRNMKKVRKIFTV